MDTNLVRLLVDPRHLRGYGLSVLVNGKKSTLLLDTGASRFVINRSLAERAGVTKLSDTVIGGIGDQGAKSAYVGLANSLKFGNLEFQDCPVEVIEQRSVAGDEGLIGADVFSSFLVDIDFPNEKLHLRPLPKRPEETVPEIALQTGRGDSDLPGAERAENTLQDLYIAPEMKNYTKVYRFGHQLLVSTLLGDAPPKLFLIDTGGNFNLISLDAAREITKVHSNPDMRVKGLSGSVNNVYRADKAVLQFGNLRQENQDITAFDLTHLSDRTGTEISGVLGFATLRMLDIKIDYRDGLVDFSYDAKRWSR
jgi:predicted aspartyl protease